MRHEITRRLAENEWFYVGDDQIVIRRYPAADQPDFMVFEGLILPGGGPPTLHTHASSEFFYTLEGELTYFLQWSDGSLHATNGPRATTAFIPPSAVHTYRNLSPSVGRVLAVVRPGSDLAAFFNEVAVWPTEERLAPAEVTRIYSAYGTITQIDPSRIAPIDCVMTFDTGAL